MNNINHYLRFFDSLVNRVSDVMFGMKMGENNLGFRLSYGADSFNQDSSAINPNKIEETARYIEIGAGLSNEQYDVGVSVSLPSVENKIDTSKSDFSGFGFGARGRYFYRVTDRMVYVPVIFFHTMSGSGEANPGKVETDFSELFLEFSGALNYQPDEQSLVVLGFSFYTHHSTNTKIKKGTESTVTYTSTPIVFIGGETRIASWLIGRIGAIQNFETSTTKTKPNGGKETEESFSTSYLNFSFGLGMEVGNFLIDFDINDGSFFEGTYILSGKARDMFNRVSVTYNFGNQGVAK